MVQDISGPQWSFRAKKKCHQAFLMVTTHPLALRLLCGAFLYWFTAQCSQKWNMWQHRSSVLSSEWKFRMDGKSKSLLRVIGMGRKRQTSRRLYICTLLSANILVPGWQGTKVFTPVTTADRKSSVWGWVTPPDKPASSLYLGMLWQEFWQEVDLGQQLCVVTTTEVIDVREDIFQRESLQSFPEIWEQNKQMSKWVRSLYKHIVTFIIPPKPALHSQQQQSPRKQNRQGRECGNIFSIWFESQEGGEQMLSQHLHTDTPEPPREASNNEKFISEARTSPVNHFQARTPPEDIREY